jgi:hypothetical protein
MWVTELQTALQESAAGVICLTPDNIHSQWLYSESRELLRVLKRGFVYIYAVGIAPTELAGPLSNLHITQAQREDTLGLVKVLNVSLPTPLPDDRLQRGFERWWPELENRLAQIASSRGSVPVVPRSHDDKLDEVLEIVRTLALWKSSNFEFSPTSTARISISRQKQGNRPRVFIGSSTEGLSIAETIQLGLDAVAECTVWTQGAFVLSDTTIESIVDATVKYDFAVLVLTADDMLIKREDKRFAPRDNLLFELGLFTGALGRARTFMVYSRNANLHLPSDLAGVTAAEYSERSDGNIEAALGPVCTRIKRAMGVAFTAGK